MPSGMEQQIQQDAIATAYLRGVKDGIQVKPKPDGEPNKDYEAGYATGRRLAAEALNDYLVANGLPAREPSEIVNLLIRS